MLREIFVKEEKILEEQYPQWLEEIIQLRKDLEHGKVKQISPEELGKQFKHAEEFQDRMDKLYEQIKKEKINDKIEEMESMINKTILKELKNRGITAGKEPLEAFSEAMRKVKSKEIDDFISNWQRILRAKKMDKLTSADVQRINRDVLNFINAVESLK